MTTNSPASTQSVRDRDGLTVTRRPVRLTTETKASFKTTEFWIYIACSVGVMLAGLLVKATDGHADYFRMDKAMLFVVILTVGYLFSRGLAKGGSHDPYDADRH
ncbi:MAG: hypothetical protein ACJ735_03740 [Actinomycetes bacterium]